MPVLVAPTKSNLIKAKSSLVLSQSGFELMDKKRNVLIKEMMVFVNKAKTMHNEIYDALDEAYSFLKKANVTLGVKNVEDMTCSIPEEKSYDILLKSVMGIDIPTIKYSKVKDFSPAYGFYNSNASLDEARQKFQTVKEKIYELA